MRRILRIRQTAGLAAPARSAHIPTCARQICTRTASSTSRPTAAPIASYHMTLNSSQSTGLRYASSKSTSADPTEIAATAELQLESHDAPLEAADAVEAPLILPPQETFAPERSQVSDSTYVEAESGEGLEEVGGLDGYFNNNSHWNPAHEIKTFAPGKIMDSAVLEVAARRAVVEALAVREAGEMGPGLMGQWGVGGVEERNAVLGMQVIVSADGKVTLGGNADSVVEGLASDILAPAKHLKPGEAQELVISWMQDEGWKNVSIDDAALKFAITKRIYQLTGFRIRDAKLPTIYTVQDLLEVLLTPPKPEKVHEAIRTEGIIESLPNVKVWNRRVTPIDKEKMTGRWKVIREELEKRELPLTGPGDHDKMREIEWISQPKGFPSKKKIRKMRRRGHA